MVHTKKNAFNELVLNRGPLTPKGSLERVLGKPRKCPAHGPHAAAKHLKLGHKIFLSCQFRYFNLMKNAS